MTSLLLALILAGPPEAPARPALSLKVHLGRDQNSSIAASELKNPHVVFKTIREEAQQHYRLVVDDDAFDSPCYQIGSGERLPFKPGSFNGSGCFLLSLKSIADLDRWERTEPIVLSRRTGTDEHGWTTDVESYRDETDKPVEFPR